MAKAKREEKAEVKEEGYEFKLPAFDERAFIRREIASAKASFYTLGLGAAAGAVSVALLMTSADWKLGWLPIFATMLALRPMLQKMGFPEDVTSWKALIGSYFMLFFTALSVWILGDNVF